MAEGRTPHLLQGQGPGLAALKGWWALPVKKQQERKMCIIVALPESRVITPMDGGRRGQLGISSLSTERGSKAGLALLYVQPPAQQIRAAMA